ncbi:MAG: InlB B-repeat-containing protein [Lachnospiraceae bacterium]|nr:InlB B-repeat-containing protein [Lachnospiraceae bacterium]
MLYNGSLTVLASSLSAYTKYAGISLSPDGLAFTTDAGVRTYERYPAGYTVYTGKAAADDPTTGEHIYTETNVSEARILKWEVAWANSMCIHPIYNIGYYHGIQYSSVICHSEYAQGWFAYCADCGERLMDIYIYMNSSTARGIRTLPGSAEYYYLCPWCGGLEQGAGYSHTCKRVSANGYTIQYAANAPAGASVTGVMAATGHMYGNATVYEGASAAEAGYGDTGLRPNVYVCEGYLFTGWNTRADGSGTAYADCTNVLNLTEVNEGTVTLYAQWEKESSAQTGSGTAPDFQNGAQSDTGNKADPDTADKTGDDPESGTYAGTEDGSEQTDEAGSDQDGDAEESAQEDSQQDTGEEAEPDQGEEFQREAELIVSAWIAHSRDGCSGDFKSGEGGILYLNVQGYADRIEVVFPDAFTAAFPEVNRTFIYEEPTQTQEETLSFSIPLYTTPGAYQITVKAYREEEETMAYPVLVVSEGSVLDELRTRIRNNQ